MTTLHSEQNEIAGPTAYMTTGHTTFSQ